MSTDLGKLGAVTGEAIADAVEAHRGLRAMMTLLIQKGVITREELRDAIAYEQQADAESDRLLKPTDNADPFMMILGSGR